MTEEELEKEAREKYYNHKTMDFQGFYNHHYYYLGYVEGAEPREKRIKELEVRNEKMKCLNEEIIKALKETSDCEWLHAHNGEAKYLYLQTVIDIVNEKFEEIKEK